MALALGALLGALLAAYLTLYKLGYIGTLACGTGSCELVQLSHWGSLFGLPVAAWGLAYYLAIFGVAVLGTDERFGRDPRISIALVALTGWGVVFTGWLTYLELFRIHAICRYCVGSAAIVLALFVIAVIDFREQSARLLAEIE
jgi:uncharacterized membrane protein